MTEPTTAEGRALLRAAQAVLTEMDIIRRQWDTSKFAYPIVHIDTHEELRAVLDAIDRADRCCYGPQGHDPQDPHMVRHP